MDSPQPAGRPPARAAKALLTGVCLAALGVHLLWKPLDPVALGVLALALLPWLPSFLDAAELPGGVKFQFAKVRQEQERQARELAWVKLLVGLVVSEYERTHLRHLAADGPFPADVKPGSTFEWELRHLISLQLVDRVPGKGVRALFAEPGRADVKRHLFITPKGREYLALFAEVSG